MLCEKCKKNEARINLVKIVNGEKQEIWLCEECAKNIADIPFLETLGKDVDFPFQGLLTGVISNISQLSDKPKQKEVVCSNCGTTYKEFKKTGKVGCAACYDTFSEEINKELNDESIYAGKVPNRSQVEISQKRKLKKLKENLQQLIVKEDYEEAAIVRDCIKEIEDNIVKSNIQSPILMEGDEFDGKLDS